MYIYPGSSQTRGGVRSDLFISIYLPARVASYANFYIPYSGPFNLTPSPPQHFLLAHSITPHPPHTPHTAHHSTPHSTHYAMSYP